jgi:hypothetical protein
MPCMKAADIYDVVIIIFCYTVNCSTKKKANNGKTSNYVETLNV